MSGKRVLVVSCLPVFLLSLLGSAPQQESFAVEGAWKLVHATSVQNGASTGEYPGTWSGAHMKIWSKEHFSFVGRFKADTAWAEFYGGGRYKLNGNKYEEEIQFHFKPDLIGSTKKMLLQVRSDTLIQTWPVNEDGQIDRNNYNEEFYVRLD